jgi:glycine dehydrogenase
MTSKREDYPFYIGTSEEDIQAMLKELELNRLEDLYSHIDPEFMLDEMELPKHLEANELKIHMQEIANKNKTMVSFIGDGLQNFTIPKIVEKVCSIRGLTTAYTPYQPERSQGTLETLWIYQSAISQITGFEAINASLYERSTCLFEALKCATRIVRKSDTVIVAESIYPGDREVLNTQSIETDLNIIYAPINKETGKTDISELVKIIKLNENLAAIALPQINSFGCIEDFDEITILAHENNLQMISIVEPISLSNTGLKEPSKWGNGEGADILVAEGQHLTLDPNFGGPGLGIFGIRYNENNRNSIRSAAGRFIGKAKDEKGRGCKAIILATREQHIRREKATSNICSNQSFIATACGASLLNRGHIGLQTQYNKARDITLTCAQELTKFEGVELKFNTPFFNEFTISVNKPIKELMNHARTENMEIGVDVSNRCNINENLLLVSLSDKHTIHEVNELVRFFEKHFKKGSISGNVPGISENSKRVSKYNIPTFDIETLFTYYSKLGKQNLSPDEGIYPLGSCTMKYNPEINDWAANIEKFRLTHPQSHEEDVQGNLEVFYEIQKWFKEITGLPAVAIQPLAGAQGELVGLKMFQAYHRDNNEGEQRNVVLIPRSAHGTNPATATMAGFTTKKVDGKQIGIVTIEATETGKINFEQFKELVKIHNTNIAGVMITNPNTAGIFESDFKKISDLIHEVGGLVYMDGANMNAIAGWIDLNKLGVDAVHNNLHKTWSIPHGGGGPGDAIVAVSDKLVDYIPGTQITKDGDLFTMNRPLMSIGSFHRHHGNFAHKVRCYTYLRALGKDGIKKMSAVAVLSARYLYQKLNTTYPVLPIGSDTTPRMHEFILTLSDETFAKVAQSGTPKAQTIAKVGKLFLDFGFHAPTVAFPEVYGLMLEPTESFTKAELDGFCEVVKTIHRMIDEYPEILKTVPHFTPIDKVDEVLANKIPILTEEISSNLPEVLKDRVDANKLRNMSQTEIIEQILIAHKEKLANLEA